MCTYFVLHAVFSVQDSLLCVHFVAFKTSVEGRQAASEASITVFTMHYPTISSLIYLHAITRQ